MFLMLLPRSSNVSGIFLVYNVFIFKKFKMCPMQNFWIYKQYQRTLHKSYWTTNCLFVSWWICTHLFCMVASLRLRFLPLLFMSSLFNCILIIYFKTVPMHKSHFEWKVGLRGVWDFFFLFKWVPSHYHHHIYCPIKFYKAGIHQLN